MEQLTGSKLGRQYDKAVCCPPSCVTSMQRACVCAVSSVLSDYLQPFVAHQAPLSMGFSRQKYGVGCHVLLQGHSMWNARLDESQAGIKISRRNNNLIHADDITIIVESEEELESLLMKVKEESEKAGLKLNIQQAKIMAPSHIISWQIEGKSGSSNRFYFSGLQNHCRWLQP